MQPEPEITINGFKLSVGQAMTVRVALSTFMIGIQEDGLGDDEHSKRMAEAYKARCVEIIGIMNGRKPDAA